MAEGLIRYYTRIACGLHIGVALYVRHPAIDRDVLDRVTALDNVVAVKYAINDLPTFATKAQSVDHQVAWVCGTAELWAPFFFAAGAEGFTSGLVNIAPERSLAMLAALRQGDRRSVMAVWKEVAPLEKLRARHHSGNNVTATDFGRTGRRRTNEREDVMNDELWTGALGHMMVRIDDTAVQGDNGFPDYADPETGKWILSPDGSWTGGFWNGMLWLAYATTREQKYLDWAERWTDLLRPRVRSENIFRSFLFYYGAALGDILTGNSLAREVGLLGARGLATLYNANARAIPLGREAEAVSDVDVGPGDANVDGVQATALLIWAARESGDKSLYEIGIQHALRFIEFCVRDDGSVIQSVRFDTGSGGVIKNYTHKGYSDDSIWARAQAWAMLGYAIDAIWEPERKEFVDTAMRTADWWIDHVPNDKVAFWDFDAPATTAPKRDTSATAIAAAALLKLSALAPGGETRQRYREAAEATVRTLVEDYLTPTGPGDSRTPGILTGGCYNHRTGLATENELIWGDYYLFESLQVLAGNLDPVAI